MLKQFELYNQDNRQLKLKFIEFQFIFLTFVKNWQQIMQDSTFPIPNDSNQRHTNTKEYAKQMFGKMTSDNSPQKSQIDREYSFFQIMSNFEKILEQYPDKYEEDTINSTKQSDTKPTKIKPQIDTYYQKRSHELQKLCTALINLNQDYYFKINQQQCQTEISHCRINLNYSLSEMSFSKEESQAKSTIKELECQISQYRKNLDNYRQKVEQDVFKLQVQNDRLKEQISKLKMTAELYQKKYEETKIKVTLVEKINQNLQAQLSNLKLSQNRSRGNSFSKSQINGKYSKQKTPTKINVHRQSDFSRIRNEQMIKFKNVDKQQEKINKLQKELDQERKSKNKIEVQYNKLMQFMLECQKQLNMKNAIIHQLSSNGTGNNNGKPQKIEHHTRMNTETKSSNIKKYDTSRRSSFRESELSPNMFGWNHNQSVTLINLLNDNLQIHWLDKIKVLYKLIAYFQQKLQWEDFEQTSIEYFSGININKNRFDFHKKNHIFLQQGKTQKIKLMHNNLCNIIDKLFQIPEIDKCPTEIGKVLQRFINEIERFFDDGVDEFHGFVDRLKNFTIRILVEQ